MAALVRSKKSGEYTARKGIPKDVRETYARLYGPSWEVLFKLPAGTPTHEAKTRHAEWLAEVETRFAALRAVANGQGQPLTRINAIALAGRWYTWFIAQHEADPRTPKHWREMDDHLAYNILYPEAPEESLENPKADPHWRWTKEPEVREAIRPQIAELARVATFLASEGLALNAEAYALFVDAVGDNLQLAIALLGRRAAGDYSPDENVQTFPAFTDNPERKAMGFDCWQLFEVYVKSKKPADGTVARWNAVFSQMQRDFVNIGAAGITEDAARSWVTGLIKTKEKYENATAAFLAELLGAYGDEFRGSWLRCSLDKDDFKGQHVTLRMFNHVRHAWTDAGLVLHVRGYPGALGFGNPGPSHGKLTRYKGTPALLEVCAKYGITQDNVREHFRFEFEMPTELVQLTSPPRRTPNTPKALKLRAEVQELNDFFAKHTLTRANIKHIGWVRKFHLAHHPDFRWNKGGRLYSQPPTKDANYQNVAEATRLEMDIDGEPVVEIDIGSSYLTIFYAWNDQQLDPKQDAYKGMLCFGPSEELRRTSSRKR